MSDASDLIRRAREMAKLAEEATPGPWRIGEGEAKRRRYRTVMSQSGFRLLSMRTNYLERDADARLIAAAPDMARLLGQLADELERLRSENARLKGSTMYECLDCGATCMGKD